MFVLPLLACTPSRPNTFTPLFSRGWGGELIFPGSPPRQGRRRVRKKARAAPRPSAEALSVSEGPTGPEALPASQAEPRSRTARARLTGTFFVPQRSSVPRQQKTSGKRGPSPEHRAVQVLRPAALGWCVGNFLCASAFLGASTTENRAVQVLRPAALGWCVCVCLWRGCGRPSEEWTSHYLP